MARGTVLLVSDSRADVGRVVAPLRAAHLEVLWSERPIEAIALAEMSRPELVLVDARLAGSDALCTRLMKSRAAGSVVAVLTWCAEDPVPRGCEALRLTADLSGLLERACALVAQTRAVRSASPLTGLPGNTAIRLELEHRLAAGLPVALLYVDLDGFKSYNDRYGFLRGDEVIRTLGRLLMEVTGADPDAFVGHVGGDDFVVVTTPETAQPMAESITDALDGAVAGFYDERDTRRGWIAGVDRRGREQRWPLLSVSIGVATTEQRAIGDPLELVDVATEMKRVAKRSAGSAIAVDRRGDGQQSRPGPQRTGAVGAWGRRAAAALAGVVVLSLPAIGVGAAHAAPGDRLWMISKAYSDVRISLAGDAAPDVHAELAERRLGDLLAALAMGDGERALLAAQEVERHERGVVERAPGVADSPAVADSLERHAGLLEQVRADACEQSASMGCEAVNRALHATTAAHHELAGPRDEGQTAEAAERDRRHVDLVPPGDALATRGPASAGPGIEVRESATGRGVGDDLTPPRALGPPPRGIPAERPDRDARDDDRAPDAPGAPDAPDAPGAGGARDSGGAPDAPGADRPAPAQAESRPDRPAAPAGPPDHAQGEPQRQGPPDDARPRGPTAPPEPAAEAPRGHR